MLNYIHASGDTSVVHSYLIHSHWFQNSVTTTKFWQVQAAIISQLWLICLLLIIIATIHPDHDSCSVKTFSSNLKSSGWSLLSTTVHYLDLSDTIAGSCCIKTAIHLSCTSTVDLLLLRQPPLVTPHPLGKFVWELLNWQEHAISLAWDDADFTKQDTWLKATTPDSPLNNARGVLVWSSIHCPDTDDSVTLGSEVTSVDGLCSAFNACPNPNIFQHYFGIEFHHEGHLCIWAISSYKFVLCFGFINHITYCLYHSTHKFALDSTMPACTPAWLLEQVHTHLPYLCHANSEIFLPIQFTAPAPTIQAFVNATIGIWLSI